MPRNQETSIDQAPPASSDPVDAAEPALEGEWVAGSRGPSATVPSQPGDPFAEDVRDDPGTRATPPFGEQATPAAGEDRGPAGDTTPLGDTTPAGDTMSTADTTPAVDADSDPSVATPPAMDADASRATETRSGRGTLPATDGARLDQPTGTLPPTDTAQLDQPATGAHAAPASAPGGAAAGLDAAGAAFVTDADGYRASWVRIQSGFVDDPHGAVTEASGLITQVTSTLVSAVQERERSLRGGWESGGADTEVLRNALREYRSFFERLMKV